LTALIVKRADKTPRFQVVAHRWKVERILAWITRHRCTVHDYKPLPDTHETIVKRATATRRPTRHDPSIDRWRPRDSELRLIGNTLP
jgi:hypothetical protein